MRRRRGSWADSRYRLWITDGKHAFVPAADVIPLVNRLMVEHGTMDRVEHLTGVSSRAMSRAINNPDGKARHETMERLALALGDFAVLPVAGDPDWSEYGHYCGAGSPGTDGCGTWFHAHHLHGLCEECWGREWLGTGPVIPRDVRVYQEVHG